MPMTPSYRKRTEMEMSVRFSSLPEMALRCLILLVISLAIVGVQSQSDTQGFISIDCGIGEEHSYTDDITSIPYVSDARFIDTGTNHNISTDYITTSVTKQQSSLRSFPSGGRNCYTLKPVVQGQKYLLRASFLYGNYDGRQSALQSTPILFDLYLGVNVWQTVNISNASTAYTTEAMTQASAGSISVCLVNTNAGTPFISSLEMRPLKVSLYPGVNATTTLVLFRRFNAGAPEGQEVSYLCRILGKVLWY